ncbi:hypothetical protein M433DRAFT_1506 [Acidomyces richmondensis BFW]|nr:hypothetical protein M433DRAFT_1506 [Acidomyces richmondensis BFW]
MAEVGSSLVATLTDAPHEFLQPSLPLYTDTVAYLKHALDPIAADVSAVQQQRQKEARTKRKRGGTVSSDDALRIKQIHTEGFVPEQIWEQARRVIDAIREEAERAFTEDQRKRSDEQLNTVAAADNLATEEESDLGEEGVDYVIEGPDDVLEEDEEEQDSDDFSNSTGAEGASEEDDDDDSDASIANEESLQNDGIRGGPADEYVVDKFGLNDGFFSIDDFNKQSEFLEQQDMRGEDDGAASDEEDIDWDADPQALSVPKSTRIRAMDKAMDGNDEDGEDGPTFGDPDAPSEDDDDDDDEIEGGELDAMGGMGLDNTNSIMYADFFAPPPQKKRKTKKGPPNPHNFPSQTSHDVTDELDDDLDERLEAVHRDLFEDDYSALEGDEDPAMENDGATDTRNGRSTHERQKADLAEEIRKLEAANVAKREWTLSGEARATDRPLNSLLEEDLEFERAGKPVPVITAEVSETIEELIKRRILAHDFQDIIRRRPDDLATGKEGRRGKLDFELNDSKSKKSLAEEYEEEALRRADPNFVDAKDEKMAKEEREIEALWDKVRTDLDSLSSWHFRPKAPAPQLDIRVDAPAIRMEDARPSAGGDVAGASQLAPQEIYKAGEATKGVREEVASKGGLPAAREELSREERKRRRRREKERIRKASGNQPVKPQSQGKKERNEVLGDLKKGGVKLIGKKGKITDVEGNETKNVGGGQKGAGRFKL